MGGCKMEVDGGGISAGRRNQHSRRDAPPTEGRLASRGSGRRRLSGVGGLGCQRSWSRGSKWSHCKPEAVQSGKVCGGAAQIFPGIYFQELRVVMKVGAR